MDKAIIREFRGGEAERAAANFEQFEILAQPLGGFSNEDRARRVWRRDGATYGVTYDSHTIALAESRDEYERGLFILVEHGGGREIAHLNTGPDWRAMRDALMAMDERTLYATLYTVWSSIADARRFAASATAAEWRKAAADKRIKRRAYPARGKVAIWIEPERQPGESDQIFNLRKRFAEPARA